MAKRPRRDTTITLGRFLDQLIDQKTFTTHCEIADVCGMTSQGLSQVLSESRRRLSVEQCLRLARRLRADPVRLLRIAGRDEAAATLEDLWPRQRDLVAMTDKEREMFQQWRDMSKTDRFHLGGLIRHSAERERARTAGRDGLARVGMRAWPPPLKRVTR